MVAKAVVPCSSDGDRDRDGIVLRVCKVVGNGTGRNPGLVRLYLLLPDRGQTTLYSHF